MTSRNYGDHYLVNKSGFSATTIVPTSNKYRTGEPFTVCFYLCLFVCFCLFFVCIVVVVYSFP